MKGTVPALSLIHISMQVFTNSSLMAWMGRSPPSAVGSAGMRMMPIPKRETLPKEASSRY